MTISFRPARVSARKRPRQGSRRLLGGAGPALLLCLFAGCGPTHQHSGVENPESAGSRSSGPSGFSRDYYETGKASWYGQQFAGRRTASGLVFSPHALTAAHRTLPLGSQVHVTNLENGRSVVVRITDRGPFAHDRVLDCSEGAARALGFRASGLAPVGIRLSRDTTVEEADRGGDYWVQVGAFRQAHHASHLQARLAARHIAPVTVRKDGPYKRIYTGPYEARAGAERALHKLQKAGFKGYVLRLDRLEEADAR